jgi:DNA-binding response OmpR family regulator
MVSYNRDDSASRRSLTDEILIVEDDSESAEILAARAVAHFDRPAVVAGSLFEAQAYLDENRPVVALLDMLLPDGDGTELLLRLDREQVPAIAVLTGAPSLYRATTALRIKAADFVVKPYDSAKLTAMFERLDARLGEHEETDRLRDQLRRSQKSQDSLRLKIDILCKDLVGGYQRLLSKVGAAEK